MQAYPETIVCKFGRDQAICLGEEAICAKVFRWTDNRRRTIALAYSWNELIKPHLYGTTAVNDDDNVHDGGGGCDGADNEQ